jgi:cytochrome c biogenesis protein CcdA
MWGRLRVGIVVGLGWVSASGTALAAPGAASAASAAAANRALDKPAFTATPAELLALSQAV